MTNKSEQTSAQQWDETLNSEEGQNLLESLMNEAMTDIEAGNVTDLSKLKD